MWVRGSLCVGSHPCWRWNEFSHGLGEPWNQVQGSHDSRSCGPEPAPGFGIENGLWQPALPGALGILARAGSWVVWAHAWCLCGMRESSASASCRQENAQDPTLALRVGWLLFAIHSWPSYHSEKTSWPPYPAVTLSPRCLSHHTV